MCTARCVANMLGTRTIPQSTTARATHTSTLMATASVTTACVMTAWQRATVRVRTHKAAVPMAGATSMRMVTVSVTTAETQCVVRMAVAMRAMALASKCSTGRITANMVTIAPVATDMAVIIATADNNLMI